MKITVDNIMSLGPCPDYTKDRVERLWNGRSELTLTEIMDLDIPALDRIWAISELLPVQSNAWNAARKAASDAAYEAAWEGDSDDSDDSDALEAWDQEIEKHLNALRRYVAEVEETK